MKFPMSLIKKFFRVQIKDKSYAEIQSKYIEAVKVLKKKRKEYGISRKDLSVQTRISISVLEAIEKGWVEKLPEKAYLSSMLIILEDSLGIERNKLKGILDQSKEPLNSTSYQTFTPGNIEIYTTWQGSLIYFIIMFVSIIALNNQQRYLVSLNSISLNPIGGFINKNNTDTNSSAEDTSGKGNKNINYNKNSKFKYWLSSFIGPLFRPNYKSGLLEINVKEKSTLMITSRENQKNIFTNFIGNIKINLMPPIKIQSNPPLSEDSLIKWNGENSPIIFSKKGIYLINQDINESNTPRKDLPQKAPLSP